MLLKGREGEAELRGIFRRDPEEARPLLDLLHGETVISDAETQTEVFS